MSQLKIISVNFHRNGSAGTGHHVVRFDEGRREAKRRLVGVVFPERRSVAVLDVDLLVDEMGVGDEGRRDGAEYEDDLREAVVAYEQKCAGGVLDSEEERELKYGKHKCTPYRRDGGLILDVPEGACVVCGERKDDQLGVAGLTKDERDLLGSALYGEIKYRREDRDGVLHPTYRALFESISSKLHIEIECGGDILPCCNHAEESHGPEGCMTTLLGLRGPEETDDVCPCDVRRIDDHVFAGSDAKCGHPMDHPGELSREYPGGEPTKETSEVCGLPESAHKARWS